MTAADQIRALADTGTPGPWKFQQHPSRRDSTVLLGGDSLGVGTFVAHYLKGEADAAKIVAAVNALPALAAFAAAFEAFLDDQNERTYTVMCVAWDALVAALGVTA